MGACLSCLGLSQNPSDEEPSETERLLYDEAGGQQVGYGTARPNSRNALPDPEEEQRHREMLQNICAETARNLIDVQHTSLLTTLRGKPSSEFAALLNTHFPPVSPHSPDPAATASDREQEGERTPQTPQPRHAEFGEEHQREPPSPFTQAQIQAAASSAGASTNGTIRGWGRSTTNSSTEHGSGEAQLSKEEAEEEAWLATVTGKGDIRVDEVKAPEEGLVMRLDGDGR